MTMRACLLVLGLLVASLLPPTPATPTSVAEEGFDLGPLVKTACGLVNALFPCARLSPLAGAAGYGACAVVFAELAATPCLVGAAAGVAIGYAGGALADPKTCTSQALSWKAYDDCWTGAFGGTKDAIQHAQEGNAGTQDVAMVGLDVLGAALPMGRAAPEATATAKLAKDVGLFEKLGAKVKNVGTAVADNKATRFLSMGTKQGGTDLAARGLEIRAVKAEQTVDATTRALGLSKAELLKGLSPAEKATLRKSPTYLAGSALESTGKLLEKPAGRLVGSAKNILDFTEGNTGRVWFLAPATDLAKNGQDQPEGKKPPTWTPPGTPDPNGMVTNGADGHAVTITLLAPSPAGGDTFVSGEGTPISFRVQSEAGLSDWSLWTGTTRLAFESYAPPEAPTDLTQRVSVNTQAHPYPAGDWHMTLVANDGVTTTKLDFSFHVAAQDGTGANNPTGATCGVDLNANGVPDCVEALTSHFTPPLPDGKPNYIILASGLIILLGVGIFLVSRVQEGIL